MGVVGKFEPDVVTGAVRVGVAVSTNVQFLSSVVVVTLECASNVSIKDVWPSACGGAAIVVTSNVNCSWPK